MNITQIQRMWEQMNLTYLHGVREIWVLNVGDLKPMEYPIQFFLDQAWDPTQYNPDNLLKHTQDFCATQFGEEYAEEAARLIDTYTKYNRRVTPEMLTQRTYSLENYNEWQRVKDDYKALELDALRLYYILPEAYRDAFDQLVLFPIQACANLYKMYYAAAMNAQLAKEQNIEANVWADKVDECFKRDSVLTHRYHHVMANGKWNHIMSQHHIGYRSWQEPRRQTAPRTTRLPEPRIAPAPPVYQEADGYVSVLAENFTRRMNGSTTEWVVIPNLGREGSAITTQPYTNTPDAEMYLEYDFVTDASGEATVHVVCSSTLNFNDYKGMRYAISIDGGEEQIVNVNGHYRGELGRWQSEHVISTDTKHQVAKKDKHTLRIRPLDQSLVLQKVMIDFGGLKRSYLGAPQSEVVK
jgi:hypothetical protein